MAENAAHISTVPQARPTIFELVAQDSLMSSIQPSFKSVCELLALKNKVFQWCLSHFEECYLVFDFLVQYNYLRTFKASFSESFYGLQRIVVLRESKRLPFKEETLSAIYLVLFPYVRIKLQTKANHCMDEIYGNDDSSSKTRWMKLFVAANKTLNAMFEALRLYHLGAYVAGYSKYHSPLIRWAGVELEYRCPDSRTELTWADIYTRLFDPNKKISSITFPVVVKLIGQLLEMVAFFVQFLRWWHSEIFGQHLVTRPVPEPPQLSQKRSTDCPLCHRKRRVEVALQTSGYVYCYTCIRAYLLNNRKCPVTQIPSTIDDLIRIHSLDIKS